MHTTPVEGVRNARFRPIRDFAILFAMSGCITSAALADPLADAEAQFYDAEFETAAETLAAFLETSPEPASDSIRAHLLLARCRVRLGHERAALSSFCDVLRADPEWQPDPMELSSEELRACRIALATCPRPERVSELAPPLEVEPSDGALTDGSEPSWHQRTRWRLGLGLGVTTLALLLMNGGGDEASAGPISTDVPGFPDPPSVAHLLRSLGEVSR